MPTLLFDAVEGHICVSQQGFAILTMVGINGNPNTTADIQFAIADLKGRFQGFENAFGNLLGGFGGFEVGQQDGKFVSTPPGDDIVRSQTLTQALSEFVYYPIAVGVTEGVVNGFEAIDIQEHHPHGIGMLLSIGNGFCKMSIEEGAIGQTRQLVVEGLIVNHLFGVFSGGNIAHHAQYFLCTDGDVSRFIVVERPLHLQLKFEDLNFLRF